MQQSRKINIFTKELLLKKLIILRLVLFNLALSTIATSAWANDKTSLDERIAKCDPYTTSACLDNYLGGNFITRFLHYYKLEMGHSAAPINPNALSSHREGWPATPQSTPPMPFTEWPYGATTAIGVSRPNSVDSPLMVGLGNTSTGKWLQKTHIQIYGWLNGGGNISTNTVKPGGNIPMGYLYTPNTVH